MVSLTQTFDSLGSINASRHVASRKEQARDRGEARTRVWYPTARHAENRRSAKERCNDSYKLRDRCLHVSIPRVSHFAVFYRAGPKVDENRAAKPGNDDRLETRSRYFSGVATKSVTSSRRKTAYQQRQVLACRSRIRVAAHSLN